LNKFLLKESNSKIQITHHPNEVVANLTQNTIVKPKKFKKDNFVPIKHSPKKPKKEPIVKKEEFDKTMNYNTADESIDERNSDILNKLMTNLKPTQKTNPIVGNIFRAPVIDRTKSITQVNDAIPATRQHVKDYNLVLGGDPTWGFSGQGLAKKWITKKFF
jgi:hypothetical protein